MNRNLDLALFGMFFALSLLMFLAGFAPQIRAGSRWIRLALLVVGPLGMTWAIFCACLRLYQHELGRSTYHMLHDLKIGVGGIAGGMFIVLLLSSEFRALATRKKT
jgi:hypothetical protein